MKYFITLVQILLFMEVCGQSINGPKAPYICARIYHENDFLIGSLNNDRNYTGGLKTEILTNYFHETLPIFNPLGGAYSQQGVAFGLTVFTPDSLDSKDLVNTNDRPFASFRWYGFSVSSVNKARNSRFTYEVQIGSMGASLACRAQTWLHAEIIPKSETPTGWPHQIANGGAFTVNLFTKFEKLINVNGWVHIIPAMECNLGNYMTTLTPEVRLSLFNINMPIEAFPGPQIQAITENSPLGFQLYVAPRLRFVAHNATLTGKGLGRSSVYTIPVSDVESVVPELAAGVVARVYWFSLGYNVFGRYKEFSFQPEKHHWWAGAFVSANIRL